MKISDILEVANVLYSGDNIGFSEEENKSLSDLFKKQGNDSFYEHYFLAFSGITEEQKEYIQNHDFVFEFYVQSDNVYLRIDDKIDVSLCSRLFEFQQAFFDFIKKKNKEKD